MPLDQSTISEHHVQRAWELFRMGRHVEGIRQAQEGIAADENNAEAYVAFAAGHFGLYPRGGRLKLAREAIQTSLRLDPEDAHAYYVLALIQAALLKRREAR